jgi:hypothetical protein
LPDVLVAEELVPALLVAVLVVVLEVLPEQQVNCTQAVSAAPPLELLMVKKYLTTALAGIEVSL